MHSRFSKNRRFPKPRNSRLTPFVKKAKKQFKRDIRLSSTSYVIFNPLVNNHCPLPQRYFTRFVAAGSFYTSSGTGTGDYTWNFKLNSMYQPFNTSLTGVTWNNLTVSSYNPAYYTNLVNSQTYLLWNVYKVVFEFDVTPQSVTDTVQFVGTPSRTVSDPPSLGAALSKPLTKQMNFASGRTYRPGADYPYRHKIQLADWLGISRQIYNNDVGGTFTGGVTNDPPGLFYYVVNCATGDNSELSQPLEVRVRIQYFVRLWDMATENATIT